MVCFSVIVWYALKVCLFQLCSELDHDFPVIQPVSISLHDDNDGMCPLQLHAGVVYFRIQCVTDILFGLCIICRYLHIQICIFKIGSITLHMNTGCALVGQNAAVSYTHLLNSKHIY